MKREILFKAKRVDNNEWVFGLFGYNSECKHSIINYNLGVYKCTHIINSETVCQFTGLLDKNGNKIFEGDVVDMEYTDKKAKIKWRKENCSFNIESDRYKIGYTRLDYRECIKLLITSNIHD